MIPRDRHAAAAVARWPRPDRRSTASPPRSATSSAPRCARRSSRSPAGQKGSSAMPHKQNPIVCERDHRPGPRAARQRRLSASRTCRSGTSATSRTRPPSGSCCPTRRSRSTTCSTASPGWSRAWPSTRSGCCATWRPRTAWCSRAGRCWRWSRPGCSREAAYEVVQRNALRAWDEETLVPGAAGGRPRRDGAAGRGRPRPRVRPGRASCATSTTIFDRTLRRDWRWSVSDALAGLHEASGKVREIYRFGDDAADGHLRPDVAPST